MRATAGKLDKRVPTFCVMAKSMYVNGSGCGSQHGQREDAADFNQKLKQGYDQLRAAQAIMEQTMRYQAAFQANFDKKEAIFRNSPESTMIFCTMMMAAAAPAPRWSDLIRGVDNVNHFEHWEVRLSSPTSVNADYRRLRELHDLRYRMTPRKITMKWDHGNS